MLDIPTPTGVKSSLVTREDLTPVGVGISSISIVSSISKMVSVVSSVQKSRVSFRLGLSITLSIISIMSICIGISIVSSIS